MKYALLFCFTCFTFLACERETNPDDAIDYIEKYGGQWFAISKINSSNYETLGTDSFTRGSITFEFTSNTSGTFFYSYSYREMYDEYITLPYTENFKEKFEVENYRFSIEGDSGFGSRPNIELSNDGKIHIFENDHHYIFERQ